MVLVDESRSEPERLVFRSNTPNNEKKHELSLQISHEPSLHGDNGLINCGVQSGTRPASERARRVNADTEIHGGNECGGDAGRWCY